jgi:hypothetical protein
LALGLAVLGVTAAQAQGLTALTSFAGDGWLAPGENNSSTWLGTANLERGMAYNKVTNSVYVVTRNSAGTGVKIVDGTTGALKSLAGNNGNLFAPSSGFAGGTFVANMIAATDTGEIFMGNLAGGAGNFRIYRWSSENDTAPGAFDVAVTSRIGDSLDVTGTGSNVSIIAGGTGTNGYLSATWNGSTITGSQVALANQSFRIANTFTGAAAGNVLLSKQTSNPLNSLTPPGTTLTSLGNLSSAGEAAMDYVEINGVGYLAVLDMNNSNVRVYDITTTPGTPTLIGTALTTTSGTLTGNANATGQVRWGNVTGTSATLYAMSSNQGIQAMTFESVPEPMTMTLLAAGLAGSAARRRRKS